jgi:N-acetylglucosamine-6-phosphate deacetylase
MDATKLKIFNGRIITPGGIIRNGTVIISGDTIELVTRASVEIPGAVEIDAGGKYISPGFIDMHSWKWRECMPAMALQP